MSAWSKVREVLVKVAHLEPVAVQGVIRAVFVFAATVGVTVSDDLQGRALAGVAALYAVLEVAGAVWARVRTTPSVKVVEATAAAGRLVIAGPANELVDPGDVVRERP